jgi:CDP-2,3-bis-(O-geranylgeranyl)-sn-glycerol synthase
MSAFALLALIVIANGTPILLRRSLGPRFRQPVDGGRRFFDRRRLFGPRKTVIGVVAAIAVTAVTAPTLGVSWSTGLQIGALAMLGDLTSSFVKRRLSLAPSARAPGLDQLPESLFPALAVRHTLQLDWWELGAVVAAFLLFGSLVSPVLHKLRIRNRPY